MQCVLNRHAGSETFILVMQLQMSVSIMSNDVNSWTGNADHNSRYTQQWVDASSSACASLDEPPVIPEALDQGFATQLYRSCLHVFRHLCNEAKDHVSQRLRLSSLKDELAKLYLWGEDFGGAELDDVLEHSEDVRKVVLELLGDIGRTLLRERKACEREDISLSGVGFDTDTDGQ